MGLTSHGRVTLPICMVVMSVISGSAESSFQGHLSPQGNYELITGNQHITASRFTLAGVTLPLREFGPSGVSCLRQYSNWTLFLANHSVTEVGRDLLS